MLFRQATAEDLDAVMAIIENGRSSLASQGLDQWQGGSPTVEMISADIEAGHTHVVVDEDGTCLGTIALIDTGDPDFDRVTSGAWLTESANSPEDGEVRYLTIHRLATAKAAVRKGVATFMIERSYEMAREKGFASVRVDTHEGNVPMQSAFEKNGMAYCCDIDITNPLEPTKKRVSYEFVL